MSKTYSCDLCQNSSTGDPVLLSIDRGGTPLAWPDDGFGETRRQLPLCGSCLAKLIGWLKSNGLKVTTPR